MQDILMPNEDFEPSEDCERVLEVFKENRKTGKPWGRTNPRYIIDETGQRNQMSNTTYDV